MRTATKFHGITIADHADLVAIFFAEKGHSPHSLRLCDGHTAAFVASDGLTHLGIGQMLNGTDFFGSQLLEMGEVETQHFRRHERSALLNMGAQHFAQSFMEQVGCRVVARCGKTRILVDLGFKDSRRISRHLFGKMNSHAVLAFGVVDLGHFTVGTHKHTAVAYLTAHFRIEGRLGQNNLIELAFLLLNLAVAQNPCGGCCIIVSHKRRFAFVNHGPIVGLNSSGIARTFFLSLHLAVETGLIECHAIFLQNKLREVERESIGIVKYECLTSGDLCFSGSLGGGYSTVEHAYAVLKSAQERIFLLFDHLHDQLALCRQFGIGLTHALDKSVDETVHECLFLAKECVGVTHGTAQDAADHVSGLGITRELRVGDRERDGAHMVGDNTHGDVNLGIITITLARQSGNLVDQRSEHIGIVV